MKLLAPQMGASSHRSPVTKKSHTLAKPGRLFPTKRAEENAKVKKVWLDTDHYEDAQDRFNSYKTDEWMSTLLFRLTPFILGPWLLLTFYVLVLVMWVQWVQPSLRPLFGQPIDAHVVLGSALSFLVVFRTNASYDRWSEARNAFQTVISLCQHLAVRTAPSLRDHACRERFYMELMAFGVSLKSYLRDELISVEEVGPRMDMELIARLNESTCSPLVAIRMLGSTVQRELNLNATVDGNGVAVPDILAPTVYAEASEALKELTIVVGICDRIKSTPMVYGYVAVLRSFLMLWLLTLPTALIDEYGWVAVPTLSLIAFLFLTIEQMAIEIEQPFGDDANDLPLEQYLLELERALLEMRELEGLSARNRRGSQPRVASSDGRSAAPPSPVVLGARVDHPHRPPSITDANGACVGASAYASLMGRRAMSHTDLALAASRAARAVAPIGIRALDAQHFEA